MLGGAITNARSSPAAAAPADTGHFLEHANLQRGYCPHELANNLSRRSVLEPADLKKLVAQLAFHSDSKSDILAWHATSVTIGYTWLDR